MVTTNENGIEQGLIAKLCDLKYVYRPDIRDRASLERNFRAKFEELNRVKLTDSEFSRLLDSIITPDVFQASRHLREQNSFEREDGTPLFYTLVNIKDWCKNTFEVVNQLRINTDIRNATPSCAPSSVKSARVWKNSLPIKIRWAMPMNI